MSTDTGQSTGVRIDETRLASHGSIGDYWTLRRPMWQQSGRLQVLRAGFVGDVVLLGPLSADDAAFVRDHLIEQGAPAAAVKTCAFPAARAEQADE
jgi:hypothetical protein